MASLHPVRSPISPRWTLTWRRHTNPPHTKAIISSQNSGRAGCVRTLITVCVKSTVSNLSTHRPARMEHWMHNSRSRQHSWTQQRMRVRRRYHFRLHRRLLITHQRLLWLYRCPNVRGGLGHRTRSSLHLLKPLLLPLQQVRVQLIQRRWQRERCLNGLGALAIPQTAPPVRIAHSARRFVTHFATLYARLTPARLVRARRTTPIIQPPQSTPKPSDGPLRYR
jgi:hypothetical protein